MANPALQNILRDKLHDSPSDPFVTRQDAANAGRGIVTALLLVTPFWAGFVWWWLR